MSEPQALTIGDNIFVFSEDDAGYSYETPDKPGNIEGPFESLWHAVKTAEESTLHTRTINGKQVVFKNYTRLGPPGRNQARGWFWNVTGREAPADFYGSYTNMASAVLAAERAIPEQAAVAPAMVAPPAPLPLPARVTLDTAREAAVALKNSHGEAAVKKVLARFDIDGEPVTRVWALPKMDREDFITECQQYAVDNPRDSHDPEAAAPA